MGSDLEKAIRKLGSRRENMLYSTKILETAAFTSWVSIFAQTLLSFPKLHRIELENVKPNHRQTRTMAPRVMARTSTAQFLFVICAIGQANLGSGGKFFLEELAIYDEMANSDMIAVPSEWQKAHFLKEGRVHQGPKV